MHYILNKKQHIFSIFYKKNKLRIVLIFLVLIVFFLIFWFTTISSPDRYEPVVIHIKEGDALKDVAQDLEEKKVVRSGSFLLSMIAFLDKDRYVPVGDYYFDRPVNLYQVAFMLASGTHNIDPIKVTFPEGTSTKEMAKILSDQLPEFDKDIFLKEVEGYDGYLFPDTYFFFPMAEESEIASQLKSNFEKKTKDLLYGKENEKDIIIMASIVELEANDENDAPIIAGILWKRLELGMPLQVDVWKETYKKKGLPDRPITNPGLVAIEATINKEETPYLYYLHSKSGDIYLAKTYTEHKKNIAKYLK